MKKKKDFYISRKVFLQILPYATVLLPRLFTSKSSFYSQRNKGGSFCNCFKDLASFTISHTSKGLERKLAFIKCTFSAVAYVLEGSFGPKVQINIIFGSHGDGGDDSSIVRTSESVLSKLKPELKHKPKVPTPPSFLSVASDCRRISQ